MKRTEEVRSLLNSDLESLMLWKKQAETMEARTEQQIADKRAVKTVLDIINQSQTEYVYATT